MIEIFEKKVYLKNNEQYDLSSNINKNECYDDEKYDECNDDECNGLPSNIIISNDYENNILIIKIKQNINVKTIYCKYSYK